MPRRSAALTHCERERGVPAARQHSLLWALRIEPLRVRVGHNRIRFAVFLLAFVIGSAVLLALAFVAIAGLWIGLVVDTPHYYSGLATIVAAVTGVLLVLGGVATVVRVSNAEHWVRRRFDGVELDPDAHSAVARAVADLSIAGGLPEPPRLLLFDVPSANACAIGVSRRRPVIGVTQGLIDTFTPGEQQAVIATLIARITRGDILVGTAVAALMGPLRQLRVSHDNGCAGTAGMIPFIRLTWVAIVERHRYDLLREVLGVDGLAAALPDWGSAASE
jgi:Zn-dependent protease with chaperone function